MFCSISTSATAAFTNDPRCPADFDPLTSCPSSMILPGGAGFDLTRNIDPTTCNDQENCPRCLGDDTWQQKLKDEVGLYSALRDPDFKPWVIVDNWLSQEIVSTMSMILLRDAMNISARAATKYTEGNIDFICCSDFSVNMEQWATSGLFVNDTTEGTVSSRPIGYIGQAGIYIPSYVLDTYPFAFTYQAYQTLHEYSHIFPPSFSTDCTNMTVNSTAGCTAGNYVCENNLWTNTTCYDGKWYVPPQCNIPGEVNPNTTHCQEVLMADPTFDSGYTEGVIKNNGLNMTGAYLGVTRHNAMVREFAAKKKHFVFYWFGPDPLLSLVPSRRFYFDEDTPECESQRSGDPTLNTAKCDFPSITLLKRTRTDALAASEDFSHFFNTFSLTRAQIDALMLLHTTGGGTSNVYDISCNWIKDNFDTWKGMVQNTPPAAAVAAPSSTLSNPGVLAAVIIIPVLIVLGVCAVVFWFICSRRLKVKNAPQTAPLALIFTDIVNSTMLWQVCGDDMGLAVEIHHAIIRKHIEEFGAYEVKTIGDSFMIACSSLGDATLMCLAIQTSLGECRDFPPRLQYHTQPRPVVSSISSQASTPGGTTVGTGRVSFANGVKFFDSKREHGNEDSNGGDAAPVAPVDEVEMDPKSSEFNYPIRIRIGLHWCLEVNPTIDRMHGRYDYYGHDVNVSARVEAQASGGQIMVTADTMEAIMDTDEYYLLIAPDIVSGIAKRDVELKGVTERVVLHALAPTSPVESGYIKFNLPKEPTGKEGGAMLMGAAAASFKMAVSRRKQPGRRAMGSMVMGGSGSATSVSPFQSSFSSKAIVSDGDDTEDRQLVACRNFTISLFRASFKAVPLDGKNSWLVAMSNLLRIPEAHQNRPRTPGSSDRVYYAKRFEHIRRMVEDNCIMSLTDAFAPSGDDAPSAPLVVSPSEFARSCDGSYDQSNVVPPSCDSSTINDNTMNKNATSTFSEP